MPSSLLPRTVGSGGSGMRVVARCHNSSTKANRGTSAKPRDSAALRGLLHPRTTANSTLDTRGAASARKDSASHAMTSDASTASTVITTGFAWSDYPCCRSVAVLSFSLCTTLCHLPDTRETSPTATLRTTNAASTLSARQDTLRHPRTWPSFAPELESPPVAFSACQWMDQGPACAFMAWQAETGCSEGLRCTFRRIDRMVPLTSRLRP